jgi:hypothetical protein
MRQQNKDELIALGQRLAQVAADADSTCAAANSPMMREFWSLITFIAVDIRREAASPC